MANESLTYNRFEIFSNEDKTSVDLRAGSPVFEYRESVFTYYVTVSCSIVDVGTTIPKDGRLVSLLEGLKCQGGEKVLLSVSDDKGNKIDLSEEDSLRLAVVRDINETFKSTSFTITLFSPEYIEGFDENNYCYDLYSGKVSDVVMNVVTNNLKSNKPFVGIDRSKNEISLHGLGKEPIEFLTDCQMLAVPDENQNGESVNTMAGYLFWQTSEGFNFKSLDSIFKFGGKYLKYRDSNNKKIKHYVETFRSGDDSVPLGFADKILHSSFSRTIDLIAQFQSGAYGARLETMDHVASTYSDTELSTSEEGNRIIAGRNLPNFGEYSERITTKISMPKAKGQTTVNGDSLKKQVENTDKEKYDVNAVVLQSLQNYRQKMNFSVQIIIPGDFSLHAGDLIYCEFRELSNGKTTLSSKDRNSGIYMIADLCHFGNKAKTFTGLHLVRDSYGAKSSNG
jgi:hypothetical protein